MGSPPAGTGMSPLWRGRSQSWCGGGALPATYSWALFHAQHWLWNHTPEDRGWKLFYSGVAQDEKHQAGLGILTSPWMAASVLEFSPMHERVASLQLQVAGRKALTVVGAYTPNSSSEYQAFLGSLCSVLERVPPGGSTVDRPGWLFPFLKKGDRRVSLGDMA